MSIASLACGKLKDMSVDGIHVPSALMEYGPAEDENMIPDHLVGANHKWVVKDK